MSYTRFFYHLIIRTKASRRTLPLEYSDDLYAYLSTVAKEKGAFVHLVNGMEEHIHLGIELPPTMAFSDFVRDFKSASSLGLREKKCFRDFEGWGRSYAAFSCRADDFQGVLNYIANQREHHKRQSFADEIKMIAEKIREHFDERDLVD